MRISRLDTTKTFGPLLALLAAALLLMTACAQTTAGNAETPTPPIEASEDNSNEQGASNTPTPAPAMSTPAPTATPAPDEFVLHIEEPVEAETITSSDVLTVRGRTRADAALTIGDAFVEPNIDGLFSVDVPLQEGPNVVEVVASIATGEELSQVLTVIYIP
jgi:hypothetical protein